MFDRILRIRWKRRFRTREEVLEFLADLASTLSVAGYRCSLRAPLRDELFDVRLELQARTLWGKALYLPIDLHLGSDKGQKTIYAQVVHLDYQGIERTFVDAVSSVYPQLTPMEFRDRFLRWVKRSLHPTDRARPGS